MNNSETPLWFNGKDIIEATYSNSEDGLLYVNNFISGISGSIYNIQESIKMLSTISISSMNSTYPDWIQTGAFLASGIQNGINSMAIGIKNAAISVASGAVRAIRITWSIHSPSKVGEELGMYWDLVLIKGLEKYSENVEKSSMRIGNTVIDNMDMQPTIRPVVDLSNVTNGFDTIDSLFNVNRSLRTGMFSGNSFAQNASLLNNSNTHITGKLDNTDVVKAIDTLASRFDNLSTVVSNMQVVLDTGVLVGQTSSQMDMKLGTLASRRGRGN